MDYKTIKESVKAAALEFEEEPMDDYYEKRFIGYPSRLRVKKVIEELGSIEGMKILDVGCEAGYVSTKLLRKGARVIAFDIHEPALKNFEAKLRAKGIENTKPFVALSQKIPLKSGSVDAIVATEVIEHMPELDLVFREFHRILKAGGKLVITFPNESLRKILYPIAKIGGVNTDVEKKVTLFQYTMDEIKARLKTYFKVTKSYSVPWFFPLTNIMVCRK